MDGVVTDDNDAFLFGCTHVYRHIFDNNRWAWNPWGRVVAGVAGV